MLLNLGFSNYFYGAFDLRLLVESYPDLAEAALSQDFADLVPVFDVLDQFETSVVLKINDAGVLLV